MRSFPQAINSCCNRVLLRAQRLVTAIAERWIFRGFAKAEVESLFLGDFEFECLQASAFVGAIAERLIGTTTTGTPPMGACFYFKSQLFFATYDWFFRHGNRLLPSTEMSIDLWAGIAREQITQGQSRRAVLIENAVNGIDDRRADLCLLCCFVKR
jgi:hypothetical protein